MIDSLKEEINLAKKLPLWEKEIKKQKKEKEPLVLMV